MEATMIILYFLSSYRHAKLIYAVLLSYFNTCNIGLYIFRSSKVSLQIQLKLQLIKIFRCFTRLRRCYNTKTPWRKQRNFLTYKGEKNETFCKIASKPNEACNEGGTSWLKSSSLKGLLLQHTQQKHFTSGKKWSQRLLQFLFFLGATVSPTGNITFET